MQTSLREEKGVTVVTLGGVPLQPDAETFGALFAGLLAGGKRRVVLDMGQCPFLTSTGLGVLFVSRRNFRAAGGDIRVARINRLIRSLLELTSFKVSSDIFDTVEDAVASFSRA